MNWKPQLSSGKPFPHSSQWWIFYCFLERRTTKAECGVSTSLFVNICKYWIFIHAHSNMHFQILHLNTASLITVSLYQVSCFLHQVFQTSVRYLQIPTPLMLCNWSKSVMTKMTRHCNPFKSHYRYTRAPLWLSFLKMVYSRRQSLGLLCLFWESIQNVKALSLLLGCKKWWPK